MEQGTILTTGYNPNLSGGGRVSRRIFLAGMGIACLGFVPLLQACDKALPQRGKEKEMTGTVSVVNAVRPPIDASAPAKTQTATFALG